MRTFVTLRYADGIVRIVMGRPTIRTEAASGAVIHVGAGGLEQQQVSRSQVVKLLISRCAGLAASQCCPGINPCFHKFCEIIESKGQVVPRFRELFQAAPAELPLSNQTWRPDQSDDDLNENCLSGPAITREVENRSLGE